MKKGENGGDVYILYFMHKVAATFYPMPVPAEGKNEIATLRQV
jgi:hypothetical protein